MFPMLCVAIEGENEVGKPVTSPLLNPSMTAKAMPIRTGPLRFIPQCTDFNEGRNEVSLRQMSR